MVKRILLAVIGLVVLLVGGWAGHGWWTRWRFIESTDDAYVKADTTLLSPKIAGIVTELGAWDNQPVVRGQVLVRIDDRDFRARVDQARASVAARQAEIVFIDSQLVVQQAEIAAAVAQVDADGATVTLARQELDRAASLQRRNVASRQQLEKAQADLTRAEAGLRAQRASRQAAEGRLEMLRNQRTVALATLSQVEATQSAAELDLEGTVVRAPIDGVVGNRVVQLGQYVRPGSQLLALVPLRQVYVEANFKETQVHLLRPGQPASLAVDAFPDQPIIGRVTGFSPASGAEFSLLPPENATGNFTKVVQRIPVRISVPADNPLAGRLRPGMSVVVRIDTQAPEAGPANAQAALSSEAVVIQ